MSLLDRPGVRWEESIWEVTRVDWPVQHRIRYKREDTFAPLGYGGINGSKLRQLIYLVDRYCREEAEYGLRADGTVAGIITGASVLSPQVSMAALVGRHYGLPVVVVLGATSHATAGRHPNVAIAQAAGADFIYTPVAYNPTLQRQVTAIAQRPEFAGWYRLHYGITTPEEASDEDVAAFHAVGAHQVAPDQLQGVRTLVMTMGSANSCTSVLYGIAKQRPRDLERVVLLGVGPTRLKWLQERLEAIGRAEGADITGLYHRRYHDHPDLEAAHQTDGPITIEHHDLHATGFATYQDKMPAHADGIDFHPTYEGKAIRWLNRRMPRWWADADGDTLFWIVGSEPRPEAMRETLEAL